MSRLGRNNIIHAVRIAAREARQSNANPLYVEALELALQVLETNQWAVPKHGGGIRVGPGMAVEGSSLVSNCCKALVLLDDDGKNQCVKCQQACTAGQSLAEAYGDTVKVEEQKVND